MRIETTDTAIQVQIVTYNSELEIRECLDSVLNQSIQIDRIVVVDNNSIDDTRRILTTYEAQGFLNLICLSANMGYAGAHNVGFSLAMQEDMHYVVTVNPDAVLTTDYVKTIIEKMKQYPNVGGASGKLYRDAGFRILDSVGLEMGCFYHAKDRGAGSTIDRWDYDEFVWGVSGAIAVYSVPMLSDISTPEGHIFDESFFIYKEDVDLCWRARRQGWKFMYCCNAIAVHKRRWKKTREMSDLTVSHSFANQISLLIKHIPIGVLLYISLLVEMIRFFGLCLSRYRVASLVLTLTITSFQSSVQERKRLRSTQAERRRTVDIDNYSNL